MLEEVFQAELRTIDWWLRDIIVKHRVFQQRTVLTSLAAPEADLCWADGWSTRIETPLGLVINDWPICTVIHDHYQPLSTILNHRSWGVPTIIDHDEPLLISVGYQPPWTQICLKLFSLGCARTWGGCATDPMLPCAFQVFPAFAVPCRARVTIAMKKHCMS